MKWIKFIITLVNILFISIGANASGFHYETYKTDKQVIHVVIVPPKEYDAHIIKAQNGRETVPSMAKRSQAEVAINGGFFNIGSDKEGTPSGSLVIEGKIYNIKNKMQALAFFQSGVLSIGFANPKKYLENHANSNDSLVSGIPMLIYEGNIIKENVQRKGNFYQKPHARTAIGIRSNGDIVLCVVEHRYIKDLNKITIEEIQWFLKKKAALLKERYDKKQGDLTVSELKKMLKEDFSTHAGIQGLSILELAKFLKKMGCEFALNLDGGGSSTLWIEGKVINSTIGDEDEEKGVAIVRPVSDSIIFTKKVSTQ